MSDQTQQSVKISANLPAETVSLLKKIAQRRGTTMTEALRRAIEMENFVLETVDDKGKILVEDKDKNLMQVLVR